MARRIRLTDERLPEYVANAIIELREKIDEADGFEADPDWCPDLDYVLKCVASDRKGENYRRLRQKNLGNLAKMLNKADAETRMEVLRKLGIKE